MSKPNRKREASTRALQPLEEDVRVEALETELAAYADGKANLAQLLPGRIEPARCEGARRLVW